MKMAGRKGRVAVAVGAAVVLLLTLGAGDGSAAQAQAPPESSTAWVAVSGGGNHTCALKSSGRVFCWGRDDEGQVGNDDPPGGNRFYEPIQLDGNANDWAQVSSGGTHTCGLKTDGRLFCWGDDSSGQLGDGGSNTSTTTPVQVGTGRSWAFVSAGYGTTCARKTNNRLFCWGSDLNGQLGDGGSNTDQGSPVQVSGNSTEWRQVSVGGGTVCARKVTGRLFCWGDDQDGELGDGGTDTDQNVPVEVAGALTTWSSSFSAGERNTCARKTGGRLFCWGSDIAGQLGDGGGEQDQGAPVQVSGGFTDWREVGVGNGHICARRANGTLYCWGADGSGQIGDGADDGLQENGPAQVGGSTAWTTLDAGGDHTCARKNSGRLFCWGRDFYGQIGDGADPGNPDQLSPIEVA